MILFSKTKRQVKKEIHKRKAGRALAFIGRLLIWTFRFLAGILCRCFIYLYKKGVPKARLIKKTCIIIICAYAVIAIGINIVFYLVSRVIYPASLAVIGISILGYIVIKKVLILYSYFMGVDVILQDEVYNTLIYITEIMDHLLKVIGITGAGKDTLMAGLVATLVRFFKRKTLQDMEEIKKVCYIFDFELLDKDLMENHQFFLSGSKRKIKKNFLGNASRPGMAIPRKLYIKEFYAKEISVEFLENDLKEFEKNPIYSPTKYVVGVGVNRKHFLQIIMYDYIKWWIRENVEKNYCMTNQPFIEDIDTGLPAAMFSFNFIRTKTQVLKQKNKDGKMEKIKENVFWPWKDRLVVSESECGTFYANIDDKTVAELINSGSRGMKVFNRHIISDFYWFQNDQVSDRTAKLFRELDHGYACVLKREEIEGGRADNLWPSVKLRYYTRKIDRFENKTLQKEFKAALLTTKKEDLKNLYYASSKEKYNRKIQRITKRYTPKQKKRIEKYRANVSELTNLIKSNKKNGYIQLWVCFSKTGTDPLDFTVRPVSEVIREDKNKLKMAYVTKLTFRTRDCERYDPRYMNRMGEKRAEMTKVEFADIRRWRPDMQMTDEDVEWMAYAASKDMFGISDEVFNDIRYGDGWKKYIKKYERRNEK